MKEKEKNKDRRIKTAVVGVTVLSVTSLSIWRSPAHASGVTDMVNLILSSRVTGILYIVIGVLNATGDLLLSVMAADLSRLEELGVLSAFETFSRAVRLIAMSLAVLLFASGIYSAFISPVTGKRQKETVASLLLRGFAIPAAWWAKDISLFLFERIQGIYVSFLSGYSRRWEGGMRISFLEDTFSEPVFTLRETGSSGGAIGGAISIIVSYALILLILWNFLILVLEITQRFVILVVYVYLSPLAAACGASEATSGILSRAVRAFLSGSVLYILNVWVVGISLSLLSFAQNGGLVSFGTRGMTVWAMVTYGFIKIAQQLDDVFNSVTASNPRLSGDPVREIIGMRGVFARMADAVRFAGKTGSGRKESFGEFFGTGKTDSAPATTEIPILKNVQGSDPGDRGGGQ